MRGGLPVTLLVCTGCGVDGPHVMKGGEANERLQLAIITKMYLCETPLPVDFFFILPGLTSSASPFGGFTSRHYYTTKDVDRCIENFNLLPCDQYRANSSSDLLGPFVRLILAACPNVDDNNLFTEPPYFQGHLIRDNSTGSSSNNSNRD